ncbi:MAG: penicillin-binding protein 1C [Ignavibacteria bacterium]
MIKILNKLFTRKIKEKVLFFFLLLPFEALVLNLLFPLPEMKSYSKEIYAKDGTLLTAFLTDDDKWRMYCRTKDISPDLIKAIIEKEDKWFYWHFGFNPASILRASISNLIEGKRVSGASTINMQLARMLEPKERSYSNKVIELLRAVQIELYFPKDKILELYLSLLPYGGNIEGVKSASYLYFNQPPSRLSLAQAAALCIIPNNPNLYRIDKNSEAVLKERNRWLKYFQKNNSFSFFNLNDAFKEKLKPNRYPVKFTAPHFCNFINQNFGGREVYTSLDLSIQTKSENLLWNYIRRVYSRNVTNGAVLVIKNKDLSVAAYCGSADFYDKKAFGQVNGIKAVRSPGSTLKPFLFAQALNSGAYTPKMKLLDIETDFSGYVPENFNLKFNGEVNLDFALVNSLNIPAVSLLSNIGLNNFTSLLEKGHFQTIISDKNILGLSVILGGCGVTLEELTRFYTIFPNRGKFYNLNYLKDNAGNKDKDEKSVKFFSESTVYMISEILSENKRPDLPNELSGYEIGSSRLPKIAWKTGTSYGKRDAWAIGFNPNYTIGVWMGNFNGKGSPFLSGAEMAVPLLFDLFNSIDYNSEERWIKKPDELLEREVCAETGLLPAKFCKSLTLDYFIENISHSNYCNLYKETYINSDSSIEYCPNCLPEKYTRAAYPDYPPELELWYQENGVKYKQHPEHNPDCVIRYSGSGPVILSPSENFEYLVEQKSDEKILLRAAPDAGIRIHYWYINDKFYNKSSAGKGIFFKPKKGKNKITCMDDKGRDRTILINVKFF